MRTLFAELQKQLKKRFPDANLERLREAYRFADEAHKGQMRQSGAPYIEHSLEVALNLASIGLDPVTCSAGLLHDVLEDTSCTRQELTKQFGEEIASLVDGVTKISTLSFAGERVSNEVKQAQNIRKMLVATAQDVRVLLIKLADRLHNMRTLGALSKPKRERISRETLDIYAPLCHRLGIARWKWELEDHAFHELMPEEYKKTASHVAMRRAEREKELNDLIKFLNERLAEAEVSARVLGRPKHLFSIYQKMVAQGKDFHEVMDIMGVRIVTHTEAECYNALGVVHSLWPPVPGRLKDYIAIPKVNQYQSLHTTVISPKGFPLEIQIRSEDMDRTAREGIAAHWSYKEGAKGHDKTLDDKLGWLRQMYEWVDAHGPEELMENVRQHVSDRFIYAFTPKGEVKELPAGATPLDFAYGVHTHIGHQCIGARVNGRLVPLRYHIQTGDVLEILTSKNQTPHLDWVDIVVTGRARTKIRQRLRELGELEPIDDGRARGRAAGDVLRPVRLAPPKPVRVVDDATRQKLIQIDGKRGIAVQFAKCCNPMPGQAIIGYVTKTPGLTVHRADCKTFGKNASDHSRICEASWAGEREEPVALRVITGSRPNVLADITAALRPMNVEITQASFGPADNGKTQFDFVFKSSDPTLAERVERMLQTVTGVTLVSPIDPKRTTAQAS